MSNIYCKFADVLLIALFLSRHTGCFKEWLLQFIADKFEPAECNESVEVTGITHSRENCFRDKNGCRTNGIMGCAATNCN